MSAPPLRILYRADGGHPIGTGHIWRAVRLLNAISSRAQIDARLMFADDPFARKVAATAPARSIILPPRADLTAVKPLLGAGPVVKELEREPADLIVIDMLDTPEADMRAIKATGSSLVTFDDRGAGRFSADSIVNILVEEPDQDSLPNDTRLFQGGAYVVLEPVFETVQERFPVRGFGLLRKVFVAMGGADAAGLSLKVARALKPLDFLEEVQFVCGPAFPHLDVLQHEVVGAPWTPTLLTELPGLLDRYLWCDLAIVAGGLTMYEVCCVGAPALAVCQPIDHQLELADILAGKGAMATVGYGLEADESRITDEVQRLADPDVRRSMSSRGPAIVDGKGAARVAGILLEIASRG